MMRRSLPLAAMLVVLDMGILLPSVDTPQAQTAEAPRIVAIGDVHGAFEPFLEILRAAGLIDAQRRWTGGTATFVQTGDCLDRGPGVRDVLDLLMRLEEDARRAGGRAELLLGNHEVMNMVHDLRDVSAAAFASFADARSENRRRRAYDDYVRTATRSGGDTVGPRFSAGGQRVSAGDEASITPRDTWMQAHPPGFVEYAEAFGPRGKYGRWLRSHKVVAIVGGTVFLHAGIRPESTASLDDVNRTAAREIATWDETKATMVKVGLATPFFTLQEMVAAASSELERIAGAQKAGRPQPDYVTKEFAESLLAVVEVGKWSLFQGDGPLWYRGYARWTDADEPQVKTLLDRLGANRFVTGHTPTLPGRITPRVGTRVFLIDTGMLSTYFKGGRASAIELQGGRVTAIYATEREVLVPNSAPRSPLEARAALSGR